MALTDTWIKRLKFFLHRHYAKIEVKINKLQLRKMTCLVTHSEPFLP